MRDLNEHVHCRLYRFVPAGSLGEGVATSIDREANITFIDRGVFDRLDASGQRQVFKAQEPLAAEKLR